MDSFYDRTVIVTGAATGIGFEIARSLAGNGANIILNDLDNDLLGKAASRIRKNGGHCIPIAGDAGEIPVINSLVASAVREFGHLDAAVCNAGLTRFGDFLDITEDDFQDLVNLNLRGTFFLAQRSAKQMIEQGDGGRIILMSSVTGRSHHPGLSAYGMTKAAIVFLAQTLGVELAGHGITVNAISPGATLTERTEKLEEGRFREIWERTNPTGSCVTVDEIAHAAEFLLSDRARSVTGQNIVVDGGWSSVSPPPE